MALAAKTDDLVGLRQPGTGDREVGKTGLDGLQMVPARTVAPLTADPAIAGFRPSARILNRTKVGRVTVDATPERFLGDRSSQIAVRARRLRGMFRCPTPTGIGWKLRSAQFPR